MIGIIDWIILICFSGYSLLASFLIHEWWHIKSQGFFMKGDISVNELGMTAMPDSMPNTKAYWYGGGIGSGIVHLLAGLLLVAYDAWGAYVPLITAGVIQITRGLHEGYTYDEKKEDRFMVYLVTASLMILFWIGHYYLFMR